MALPAPRGPLSQLLTEHLSAEPHELPSPPELLGEWSLSGSSPPVEDPRAAAEGPLVGEDLHLVLYIAYELHYRGFEGVDERWEWEPSLLRLRLGLERAFEAALRAEVGSTAFAPGEDMESRLRRGIAADEGPSIAEHAARRASLTELRELLVHRSAYQLKEADPHSFALPRLSGRPKAALVEIQADEYGSGEAERIHAALYARAMEALDLDSRYGAYLDLIPGVTLATVNLMSLLGLHRRLRGAALGHLALTEMTSSDANRAYASGLRRLGLGAQATDFFDEHVEADAVHDAIAVHDMAGAFATDEPALAEDVVFGALALLAVERRFAEHLLGAWERGACSLLAPIVAREAASV